MKLFYNEYFEIYKKLAFSEDIYSQLDEFKKIAELVKENNAKMIFAGNGASAAISAHGAVDFTKQAGVRGITFNEADLITCFANDFGYDNWMAQGILHYADPNDVVVLTSVSGTSPSVVNAAKEAKKMGLKVVSFTGRYHDNALRDLSDVGFWVDSHAYNIVECIHMIWLTTVIDAVIGKSVYET
jgi:D-sedoheptulose 7-phosphate isomerase